MRVTRILLLGCLISVCLVLSLTSQANCQELPPGADDWQGIKR